MTCTEKRFLADVAEHKMKVIRDDGVYRHLMFQIPETNNCWFEIVTWPGCLCINGDMGNYLFSRTPDMFDFFRSNGNDDDGTLGINRSYWAEKLRAQDCHGQHCEGVKRWSSDEFERAVRLRYVEHVRAEMRGQPEQRKELRHALENDVLWQSEEQHSAISAACSFDEHGLSLEDFWDVDCTEWGFHFVWCLYAIVWGIQRYDETIAARVAA